VTVAGNGKQALAVFEKQIFDVVLMDVQMPEMDGFETTAAIREREKSTGKHIPIIAMTAHAMKGDKERCLASGMDEYLTKPIRGKDLFDIIEAFGTTASEHSSHGVNTEPVDVAFDGEALLARLDGSTELCGVLIETFLEESPQTLSAIKIAVERLDAAAIASAAHALKGAVANFGTDHSVFSAMVALELCGKSGDLTEIERMFVEATDSLSRLQAEMNSFSEKALYSRWKT
jgi:CheY-like chemotaxis protein